MDKPEDNSQKPATSGRSRARRNVVGRSAHREEYERLMKAGWSSLAIERYAAFRYGEDVPASTIRTYKARKGIEAVTSKFVEKMDPEKSVDVLGIRAQLIELQQDRIAIDWKHEQSMSKLFGSTKGEIAALSALLDAHKSDLQDLGLMPKAGQKIEIDDQRKPTPEAGAPRAQTLGALLGADPESEMELARVLHLASKKKSSGEKAG